MLNEDALRKVKHRMQEYVERDVATGNGNAHGYVKSSCGNCLKYDGGIIGPSCRPTHDV